MGNGTEFTVEKTDRGYVFHVYPNGIPISVWLLLGANVLVGLWGALFFFGFIAKAFSEFRTLDYNLDEGQALPGPFGAVMKTLGDGDVQVFMVFTLLALGYAWLCWRALMKQRRARRSTLFTVNRSAITQDDATYPLADIAEMFVHAPGVNGALYSTGPMVIAGGSGELGAVVLSSSLTAAAATNTAMAAAAVARAQTNARSCSVNLRLRGQKKPVQIAFGLTAGPARDLLEEVVAATRG
ncbi:hypothetical protein AZA_09440 [Nitrospirillum viridazoti Y2]|uniref:Uncharacterized protein n=1 Tax=Nitrospirillum amazonense TaxID=28077 RepID=A0A560IBE9_9PROT|nr:hypothetical protein [Nitrospirillum amazonense]EGY00586.1 hypothetical protein AZA_09440 [Nitrospirillum amazonense Y2]TWB54240.1 hypothetical protein FBZ92_1157 [Nitrospirillum amazonense]